MSKVLLEEDDESDKSAHLYPAVEILLYVFVLFISHREALWPFLNLICKYFISRSLPSSSPSHSAVLAHFSFQLISEAFSKSAFPLFCSAQCLSLLGLNHFYHFCLLYFLPVHCLSVCYASYKIMFLPICVLL